MTDHPVPWPGNYDVADVPAVEFTYAPTEPAADRWVRGWTSDGPVAELFTATGIGVYGQSGFGDANYDHYDLDGRRKQYYWRDGTPASSYLPDGTQIPLYSEGGRELLTDDTTDPLWVPPEEPEEPEEPGEPGEPEPVPSILEPATLQGFAPDDMIPDEVAALAVDSATALVDAYTRGRHVDVKGRPRPGIATVVLTVAARIAANPGQVSRYDQAGQFSSRRGVGFTGFTLAERAVLNRYRKRAIGP